MKSLYNVEVKKILVRKLGSLTKDNLCKAITNAIQGEATLRSFGLSDTTANDGLIYSDNHQSHLSKRGTGDEPMDISALNGNCLKCNKPGHWARECHKEEPRSYNGAGGKPARQSGSAK